MTAILGLAVGLVLLVAGAELLVRGASRLALALGISPLIIGLTVVAYGTSAPELSVSVLAALDGRSDIALGNAVGSNIFNVLFILGLCALILPLKVSYQLVRRDVPLMIGSGLLLLLFALDGVIGRGDGMVLFGGVVLYTWFLIRSGRRETGAVELATVVRPSRGSLLTAGLLVLAGLALLVIGAKALVDGATVIARLLGVSELVIGLTIVAGGTSLPELATSLLASLRGQRELAVGNIVGSNIFNVLMILGTASMMREIPVAPGLLHFDIPVMLAVSLACLPVFFTFGEIGRIEGLVFLLYYGAYLLFLFLSNTSHDALAGFSHIMLLYAAPATLFGLAMSSWQWHRRRAAPSPAQPGAG